MLNCDHGDAPGLDVCGWCVDLGMEGHAVYASEQHLNTLHCLSASDQFFQRSLPRML